MKTDIFVFLAAILIITGCTRKTETFYENGVKSSEITYKGGVAEGEALFWHPNGELMQRNYYVNGKVEGLLQRWHANKNPEIEEEYKNDLKNGMSKHYNLDGKLTLEARYINDTLDGKYFEYYPDGSLKIEGKYKNGLFEGHWRWLDIDGVALGEAEFHQGKGIQKAWRRDGTLLREVQYEQNMKHGSEKHYDEKGNLEMQIEYRHNNVVKPLESE